MTALAVNIESVPDAHRGAAGGGEHRVSLEPSHLDPSCDGWRRDLSAEPMLDDRKRHARWRRAMGQHLRRAAHDPRRDREAIRSTWPGPGSSCPSTSRAGCSTPSARPRRSRDRSSGRLDRRRSSGSSRTCRVSSVSGVKGIIGKGELHGEIVNVFRESGAVYFAAIGGLGALLGKRVVAAEIVAFPGARTRSALPIHGHGLSSCGDHRPRGAELPWNRQNPLAPDLVGVCFKTKCSTTVATEKP